MRVLYGFTAPQSARAFLRGQAKYMGQNGFEIHVISAPGPELDELSKTADVQVHPVPMKREISIWDDMVGLLQWILVVRRVRPHVVNVGTPKAALLGMLAARLLRVPVRIYVVRGLRYEGLEGSRRKILIVIEKLICAWSTEVVVVSQSVGAAMREAGIPRSEMKLIGAGSSNGVDVARWRDAVTGADKAKLAMDLAIPEGDLIALFVGRVSRDKGISMLMDMLRHARTIQLRVTLVVVGRIEDEELADELARFSDSVRMVGYRDDVEVFYSLCDVLLLPTRREGFPNVVLEAAAAGTPAITTDSTGAVDSVIDGVTGFVVPYGDGAAMAERIKRIVEDPEGFKEMSVSALSRAENAFYPERVWSGLRSIYLSVPDRDVSSV